MAANAHAADFACAPTSPSSFASSTASPASPYSPFDRLPDELINEIGVHVYDEDDWSGGCDRPSIEAFSAAGRRFRTILKPLRWKVLRIDTSTADFARLNVLLAETGRHVTRVHLTFDASRAYDVSQVATCLRSCSCLASFNLVVLNSGGVNLPPQDLTEIYQALCASSHHLRVLKLGDWRQWEGFLAPGLVELLHRSTSLQLFVASFKPVPRPPSTALSHSADTHDLCKALAGVSSIRFARLETAHLLGLGECPPHWPRLVYLELDTEPDYAGVSTSVKLDVILHDCRNLLRALKLRTLRRHRLVSEGSGPLLFPQLETVVTNSMEAVDLFDQLVHPASPISTFYMSEVSASGVRVIKAFYDEQPTKTLERLVLPRKSRWDFSDRDDDDALSTLQDWAGQVGIAIDEAEEQPFVNELERRVWQV